MIDDGANINIIRNSSGQTPLYKAVQLGEKQIVKLLLDDGAIINYELLIASKMGYGNIVKLLLDKGADVNAKDDSGDSALFLAAARNRTIIVKSLINKSPDIDMNIQNQLDQTPYLVASVEGNMAVVKLLLQNGALKTFQCADSPLKLSSKNDLNPKGCEWVAARAKSRCGKLKLRMHCPATCARKMGKVMGFYCQPNTDSYCKDSKRKFLIRGKVRSCKFVGKKSAQKCERNNGVKETCPLTCAAAGCEGL